MAKESGLGWSTASRDDSGGTLRAIVNCVRNIDFATPRNTTEITGLDKSSTERLLLLGDYSSNWTLSFNDAANTGFCVHKTVASADVTRSEALTVSGQSLNNEVLLTDMALSRDAAGDLVITGPAVLQSGCDPTWS